MKKKILASLLAAALIIAAAVPAYADNFTSDGWKVTITADGKMESNFTPKDILTQYKDIQPGDDLTITVTVENQNADDANLYMSNKVLRSMEDSSDASNGAYTYRLSYAGATLSDTFFDSDTVGGEDLDAKIEGLHGATTALEDYFLLEQLPAGKSGTVTLYVLLDGESQINSYQDELADLQLNFACELLTKAPTPVVVKTGDETRLLPLYIALGVSGAALLGFGIWTVAKRRKEAE